MASPSLSDSKQVHLEGLQREVDFLQNENQLLEGFLQRVRNSMFAAARLYIALSPCVLVQSPHCCTCVRWQPPFWLRLTRSGRYSLGVVLFFTAPQTVCYAASWHTTASYSSAPADLTVQKGTSKRKGTSRAPGGSDKKEWHGLSLEEKNEIVSTEIEVYQAAIEKVCLSGIKAES